MALALGPGDSIYVAGHSTISSEANFALAHLNPDGTLTTSTNQYVTSPRYIDAVICRDVADGDTLQDGSRVYYLSDANHNVTALVDADGEVVERTTYTPYGQAQFYDGTWSETYETSVFDNTHLYTGRVYDGAVDLIYFRRRWYSAGVGRFVSRDPMGYEAGDENLYRYCGGNPGLNVDPEGLQVPAPVPGGPSPAYPRLYVPSPTGSPSFFGKCGRALGRYAGGVCIFIDYCFGSGASVAGGPGDEIEGIPEVRTQEQNDPDGQSEKTRRCLPCDPIVGTFGYRTDYVPPARPHFPHTGTHTHHFVVMQSPPYAGCGCFWHELFVTQGPIHGVDEISIRPAGGGGIAP